VEIQASGTAGEQSPEDQRAYEAAEDEARAEQIAIALWRDPHFTPPWEWRRR